MRNKVVLLSKEEQEEIKNLQKNYNIVPELDVYDYKASRRVDISRKGALFFLKASILCNVLTITIIFFTVVVFALKPAPLFYATHPSGSVYGPLPKYK